MFIATLKRNTKMKINQWIKSIVRVRVPRNHNHENLRCDYAERLNNYSQKFFEDFLSTVSQEDFITYPSYKDYQHLKEQIGKNVGVSAENILLGTGSGACIKDLIHVTCEQGSNIVSSSPCYPMYFVYGETFEADFIRIPYEDNGSFGLSSIMEAVNYRTRLVILTNPNSPYGDYRDPSELEPLCEFLEAQNIILLIDEAYVDFAPSHCLDLLEKYKNVIISRTFSKAWGAAGTRIGYLISNRTLIDLVSRVQLTYPVTGIGLKFILFLLKNSDEIKKYAKTTIKDRDTLCDMLEHAGYDVLRSHTNTIHFHEKHGDNQKTIDILTKHGVSFKSGQMTTSTPVSIPGDKRSTWIRLSVGPNIHNFDFIKEIIK